MNTKWRVPAQGVRRPLQQEPEAQFSEFSATELYCPKCKRLMRVREKLLLVLSTGNLYEYKCVQCGESVGSKTG